MQFSTWLMQETHAIPQFLYKWVDGEQFQKYLDRGVLPVKRGYAHYIEQVNDFVEGNSFTDEQHINRWSGKTLIKIDTHSITNPIYPIPGNKTYLRTKGMTDKNYDPKAWEFESDEIDEYWIAGTLSLKSAEIVR